MAPAKLVFNSSKSGSAVYCDIGIRTPGFSVQGVPKAAGTATARAAGGARWRNRRSAAYQDSNAASSSRHLGSRCPL